MRVNIHPDPLGTFDINIPFFSEVYSQHFVPAIRQLNSDQIVLVSNGEPPARLMLALEHLERHGIKAQIDTTTPPRYHAPDPIFKNQSCTVVPGSIDCQDLVNYYLSVYPQLDIEFEQNSHSADLFLGYRSLRPGHYWYQYGCDMPVTSNSQHQQMCQLFQPVFDRSVAQLCQLLNYSRKDVAQRLILRLNHNRPGHYSDPKQKIFVGSHWDTSVMTMWIHTTAPGAVALIDQKPCPIEQLYQPSETLILPGVDYCDEFATMTLPTWHWVQDCDGQERVAVVGFLKRRDSKQPTK